MMIRGEAERYDAGDSRGREEMIKAWVAERVDEQEVMVVDSRGRRGRLHAEKEEDACDADDAVESAEEERPRW